MKIERHINSRHQYIYKFLFICHPSESRKYYQSIKNDIFSVNDQCMILSGDVEETEEMDKILRQVNMVIVPVTSKLLKSENRAMESEIPYAIRNHIPVLPIVVEKIPDFPSLYNEKFQHIQYLNKISRETIGIPYIQKLRKTLEVYTLGLDQEKKIRDAFDLHVFLSYRKKDKFYAEELLFLIHQNQASKDIAVWYDEFLNPGKKWNDGIMDAIDQCDVYSLIVTPSIVEDGNFVQQKEYPRARQKEKVIKPIIFEEIDMSELKEKFPGIPAPIPFAKQEEIADYFYALLDKKKRVCEDSLIKRYYIGMAYLYGIGVEIDRPYAVAEIEKAASEVKTEPADPLKKIAQIYRYGNGTERNIEKAVRYMERYVDIISSHSATLPEKQRLIEECCFLRETMLEDEHNSMKMWEEHTTDVHPAEWKPYDPYGIIKTGMKIINLLEEIQNITGADYTSKIAEECHWIITMFINYNHLVLEYIYRRIDGSKLFLAIREAILMELKDNHISINESGSMDSDYWKKWEKYSIKYFLYAERKYKNRYRIIKKLNKNISYLERRAAWSDYWIGCRVLKECYASISEAYNMLGSRENARKYNEKCLALEEKELRSIVDYAKALNEVESWDMVILMFSNIISTYIEGAFRNLDKAEKLCRECLTLATNMRTGKYPLLKYVKKKNKKEAKILEAMAQQKLMCITLKDIG